MAADFDNDEEPDVALLLYAGEINGQRMFRIELHDSASGNRSLTFASNDYALAISALDVNRDGMPDLVVEQAFTHKRLQVWINDGHGGFRAARVEDFPSSTQTPFGSRAPLTAATSLVPGLPSRVERHSAVLFLQGLRFDSSSSQWRIQPDSLHANQTALALYSPRSPPAFLPV